MVKKPTYEELEQRVKELEKEAFKRKRAEEALKESEERYRLHFENVSDVIFSIDPDLSVISVSPSIERISGYKHEELVGKKFQDLNVIAPEYLEQALSDTMRVFAGERIVSSVYEFIAKDGTRKFGEISGAPLVRGGEIVAMVSVARDITERRQAEKTLRESEETARTLLTATTDSAFLSDPDGIVIAANRLAAERLGKSIDEFIGKCAWDFFPPETAKALRAYVDEIIHSGKPVHYEDQREGLYYYNSIFPVLGARGNVEKVAFFAHDITKIKQAEEALKESEERYRTLVENVPVAVYRATPGPKGKFLMANPIFLKLLGLGSEEELKKIIVADVYMNPEERKALSDNVLAKGRVAEVEVLLRKKDGTPFWGSISAKLVFDESGKDPYFDCTVMDITARKLAEEELQKYKEIVSTSNDYLSLIDKNYVYQAVNDAYLKLFNKNRDEIVGHSVSEILGQESFEQTIKPKGDRCLAGEEIHYQSWFNFPGLEPMHLDVIFNPYIDRGKKVTGIVACARDMTQQKRIEEQLQQAQRMEAIGTLAGGIAHDFNNLLMSIQGRTSLMLMDKDSSHPDFEHLTGIEEYIRSAADLTKQLLGFARGGKYEVKPTNLNEIVKGTSRMFGRTRKEINVHRKYQKEIFTVEVDQGQIEQILMNLYLNAWQAMPGGGALYLETQNVTLDENFVKPYQVEPGNYVKMSVTDTGVGMDEVVKEKIFEPFFTTKEIGRGTGLGLASVYGIIKNHGGFINVDSKRDEGATFNIYLPALEAKGTVNGAKSEESENIQKVTGTVLLVDDEEMIIDVCKQLLENVGYRVLIARSGKEAIERYKGNRDKINMVILDMIMPDMGGGEAYDRLKKINPDIKVLLSSGYSIDGQATEILKRGCDGFIQKPFNMRQLSQKIREISDKG
ncbi:MAG: PAS domain S-box protein [Deltaproteobacteria bacterium]|nr:PAS domain S-box protein [Deltaproteobacteria bacterium]